MNQNKKPRRPERGWNRVRDGAISRSNSTPIFSGTKVVGIVRDGVFIKVVSASRHFLRIPPAIAFDVECILQAISNGATRVQVIDVETGFVYSADIKSIQANGFEFNRGFGRQIALVLKDWTKTRGSQTSFSQPVLLSETNR